MTKLCKRCGREKSLEEFYRIEKGKEKRRYWCKECCREYKRGKYRELKEDVLSHYSPQKPPVCANCGESALGELCLDHVNGGGRKHLKDIGLYSAKHNKILSGEPFYHWLKKHGYPSDPPLQVLCKDCNKIKQIENNER